MEFNTQSPYENFFSLEPKWKDVSTASKEYMNMSAEILKTIPIYIKIVLEKQQQELINKIFKELMKEDENWRRP